MKDIDTCQHGLKPQCPEIANPTMADFLELVKELAITVESIDALNEICSNCSSFTPKE
jgi:hypothetical protein